MLLRGPATSEQAQGPRQTRNIELDIVLQTLKMRLSKTTQKKRRSRRILKEVDEGGPWDTRAGRAVIGCRQVPPTVVAGTLPFVPPLP